MAEQTRPAHFPLFDGLRALAALSVFAFHIPYQGGTLVLAGDHQWFRLGVQLDIGVPLFFAISGFLLYRPFLAATLSQRAVSVKAYAWRRFLRIVPAYWVALAALTIWFDRPETQTPSGWLRYGGFLQVYDSETAQRGLGQAWTLDVEVVFYIALPLFALLLVRARTVRQALLGVAVLIAAGLAWNAYALTQVDSLRPDSLAWLLSFPSQLDHLGAGMLLAILSVWADPPARLRRLLELVERRPWVPWACAGAALLACAAVSDFGMKGGSRSDPEFLLVHALRTVFAFAIVLPAVIGDGAGGFVRRLLGWRPLVLVGLISYSFYLWHYMPAVQITRWWPGEGPRGTGDLIVWTVLSLIAGLALSALSYRLIEKPALSLKRLVPAGERGAQVEAAQARAAP